MKRPVRVGVFRDVETARRVLEQAKAHGFSNVHLVCEDPVVHARCAALLPARSGPLVPSATNVSRRTIVAGALVGVAAGFAFSYYAYLQGIASGITNVVFPAAGLIWGAFIGGMMSRGLVREDQNFYDQQLDKDDILIAIEDEDPERLAMAERILGTAGSPSVPLPTG